MENSPISEIVILILFLFLFAVIFTFVFLVIKTIVDQVFDLDYKNERSKFGEPLFKCSAVLNSIGFLSFRGFSCRIEIFQGNILIKFFNRAILIQDISELVLKKEFLGATLLIEPKNKPKIYISLNSNKNYEYLTTLFCTK